MNGKLAKMLYQNKLKLMYGKHIIIIKLKNVVQLLIVKNL